MGRSRFSKLLIVGLCFTLAQGAPKFGDLFNGQPEAAPASAPRSEDTASKDQEKRQIGSVDALVNLLGGGNQPANNVNELLTTLLQGQALPNIQAGGGAGGLPTGLPTGLPILPPTADRPTDVTENCRVRINANGNNAATCATLIAPGTCRFDFTRNECLCPVASQEECEESNQCHWIENPLRTCIHKTERLYNALYEKMIIRGKKDLAIQVFYNSRPAQVSLPYGINGPQVLDVFSAIRGLNVRYPPMHHGYGSHPYGGMSYGHNPYGQSSYGQASYGQNPYGPPSYGGNSYGQDPYGPQTYGGNSYDPYGPPSYGGYGKDPHGPPSYGGNPYGPSYGGNPYGPSYGGNSYGQGPYGQYEPQPYGGQYPEPKPYGGGDYYGQEPYGSPPEYGQDYKYEDYPKDPYHQPKPYGDYEKPYGEQPYNNYGPPEYGQDYKYEEQPYPKPYSPYGQDYKPYGGYQSPPPPPPYGGYQRSSSDAKSTPAKEG